MKRITETTLFLLCGLLLLLNGCSTTKNNQQEAVFYPPPPARPRLQYLTSFSAPKDLARPSSAFRTFLLGEDADAEKGIVKPYGICVEGSRVLVCDTVANTVHELDFGLREWSTFQPSGAGRLMKVINVAVDEKGFRYVADPQRGEVVAYTPNGLFRYAIGKEDGMKPVGVAVTKDRIYVADLAHHQVHAIDKISRKKLFSLPRNPDNKAEQLFSPTNLALDNEGRLYVSDTGAFRVLQYDADGHFIQTIGEHGDGAGQFARNKGIAVDKENRLYVVDAASQTVQIFDKEGKLLLFFGEAAGNPYPMVLPAGIAISYNTDFFKPYVDPRYDLEYVVFVTNQYGPNKVAVYGFLSPRE